MKSLLASVVLVLSLTASAEPVYTIGVEQAEFLPHYQGDAAGNYHGFARDVFDRFVAHSGVRLTLRVMPAEALLPALLDGTIDAKYPDSPEWSVQAKGGSSVHYSQPVVDYVDGVMVAPRRAGLGIDALRRLAVVDGWTPRGYEDRIAADQISLVSTGDLPRMVRQALLKDVDGAYYNVVVAAHYLNNVRAKPGALVFDSGLPHSRGTFALSSIHHPALIRRFDQFLEQQRVEIAALKARYQVEANLSSEYIGMEQWKVDFIERQKSRQLTRP